jgi:hypothetical protein
MNMTTLDWQSTGTGLRADAGALGVYTVEPWHDRLILKKADDRDVYGGTIHDTIDLAKEFLQNIVNDDENPVPRRLTGYTLDDFTAILKGDAPLPNAEAARSLEEGVNNIAAFGHMLEPKWGNSVTSDGHKTWTQYFLHVYDGSGYALIYGTRGGSIVRFAICRHQKKTHPGANPSRGWHPGHCIKCGLDLTVDSSD